MNKNRSAIRYKPNKNVEAKIISVFLILAIGLFILQIDLTSAAPQGASITNNVTSSGPTYDAENRSDAGGTITFMDLTVNQQNSNWKAYVGNVSGTLVLDDSNGNTIYQWAMTGAQITGEVYSSRASNPDWPNVECSNVTTIEAEDTAIGFGALSVDAINFTFNETTHTSIVTAGVTIAADSCRATATFVNDTKQVHSTAYFQEVLLQTGTDLVYTSKLQQDVEGFDNQSVDFQLILADDTSASSTTYFFFVEIG